MAELVLYGALVGQTCATLGFYTTESLTNLNHIVAVLQKRGGDEERRNVETKMEEQSVYFMHAAWGFDLWDLEPETEYDVYLEYGGNLTSDVLTFTTESEVGNLNYNLRWQAGPNAAISDAVPTDAEEKMNTARDALISVGYDHQNYIKNDTFDIVMCGFNPDGAAAWTSGYLMKFNVTQFFHSFVHEMRHSVLFAGEIMLDYATNYMSTYYSDNRVVDNFKDVISFFMRNNGEGDALICNGENSCPDDASLYNFFLLKSIAGGLVTIVWS